MNESAQLPSKELMLAWSRLPLCTVWVPAQNEVVQGLLMAAVRYVMYIRLFLLSPTIRKYWRRPPLGMSLRRFRVWKKVPATWWQTVIIVKEPETAATVKTRTATTPIQLTDLLQRPVFIHTKARERTENNNKTSAHSSSYSQKPFHTWIER